MSLFYQFDAVPKAAEPTPRAVATRRGGRADWAPAISLPRLRNAGYDEHEQRLGTAVRSAIRIDDEVDRYQQRLDSQCRSLIEFHKSLMLLLGVR